MCSDSEVIVIVIVIVKLSVDSLWLFDPYKEVINETKLKVIKGLGFVSIFPKPVIMNFGKWLVNNSERELSGSKLPTVILEEIKIGLFAVIFKK
jgi:hypothetical protein